MATLNNVITNANGSVGIGTSSPTQLLELKKSTGSAIALLNYNDSVKFNINASSGGAGYVGMVSNHDLVFVTNDTERARLNTNGNVGIGTTSPKQKLDIAGAGTGIIALTNTGTTGYSEVMFYEGSSTKSEIFVNGSTQTNYAGVNSLNIYQNSNAPIAFYTNGNNERMRVAADGNIGIGTTSPAQKLSVVGNIYLPQGNYITWNNGDCDIGGVSGYHLVFRTYTGVSMTEKLRIQSDGNVGIGTTSPTGSLHVNKSSQTLGATTPSGATIISNLGI